MPLTPPITPRRAVNATEIMLSSGPTGLSARTRPVRALVLPSLSLGVPVHGADANARFELRSAAGTLLYRRPFVSPRRTEVTTPANPRHRWLDAPATHVKVLSLLLPYAEQDIHDQRFQLQLHHSGNADFPGNTTLALDLHDVVERSRS